MEQNQPIGIPSGWEVLATASTSVIFGWSNFVAKGLIRMPSIDDVSAAYRPHYDWRISEES